MPEHGARHRRAGVHGDAAGVQRVCL